MPAVLGNDNVLVYKESFLLRQRLLLATLRGQKIKVEEIRSSQEQPGLKEYELNLIKLLEKLTKETKVEVNMNTTTLYFEPGMLIGGLINHSCSNQKEIGYYVEVLVALGPFCKVPLNAVLHGVTFHNLTGNSDEPLTTPIPITLQLNFEEDEMQIRVLKESDF